MLSSTALPSPELHGVLSVSVTLSLLWSLPAYGSLWFSVTLLLSPLSPLLFRPLFLCDSESPRLLPDYPSPKS
jgi:hypothetical protein